MNHKKPTKVFRNIFKEDIASMLATQGPQPQAPMTDISLDQKVDHFLVQYERESVPMATQESRVPSLETLRRVLFEADDDKPEDDNTDDSTGAGNNADPTGAGGGTSDLGGGLGGGFDAGGGGGLGGGDPSGGLAGGDPSGGGGEKTPATPTPRINVSNFSRNVARLINDYQSLIDPKRIIMNRARAYLEKNYNAEIAKQFLNILDTEFNITGQSIAGKYDDLESPFADRALEPSSGG